MDGPRKPDRAALDAVFRPRAIAVVGASRFAHKVGHLVIRNLFLGEYGGTVYPVNPQAAHVMCARSYGSLADLPESVDLVIGAVPRAQVPQLAEDCVSSGARALVLLSDGFSADAEGEEMRERLLVSLKRGGVLLAGPASIGVAHTDPGVRLHATPGREAPLPGSVSVASQAGQLGLRLLAEAKREAVGIRSFLCSGDGAGVCATELLDYWRDDEQTRLIVLHLPRFGDPRRFVAVAQEVSRKKPILALKAGGTRTLHAADGPPGSLLTHIKIDLDELVHQCGIVPVATTRDAFAAARGFASQPPPRGDRVAVVANSHGPANVATEALRPFGLYPSAIEAALSPFPTGLSGPAPALSRGTYLVPYDAPPEVVARTVDLLLADDTIDAAIVVLAPSGSGGADLRAALEEVALCAEHHRDKPLLVSLIGGAEGAVEAPTESLGGLPIYDDPGAAARALGAMRRHARWSALPRGEVASFEVDIAAARRVIESRNTRGAGFMSEMEVSRLLEAFGIETPGSRPCDNASDAVAAAEALRFPVVMKLSRIDLIDKRRLGGVILGPANELEVRGAFTKLADVSAREFGEERPSILVQEYVRGGIETAVGVIEDAEFGPLVVFGFDGAHAGLDGAHADLHGDLSCHVTPVTDVQARAMVRSTRAYRLLDDAAGADPVDPELLVGPIQRVSQMVTELHDIEALELNPLVLFPETGRTVAVDARVRVRSPDPAGTSLLDVL